MVLTSNVTTKIYLILDFLKVKHHTKRKKENIKINHSTVHTLNTNYYLKYYNPLNNKKLSQKGKK